MNVLINVDANIFSWADMAYTFVIATCLGAGLVTVFCEFAWHRKKKGIEKKLSNKRILHLANKTSTELKKTLELCNKELGRKDNSLKEPKN
jgi:hypothetical protein